jgi:MFS family permease
MLLTNPAETSDMQPIETDIPARLDRLPWSRFHLLIVVALGITWVLDGMEVTIVGSIGPMLQDRRTLGLSPQEIGSMASAYVAGAVAGALFFGWLTDRFGRRLVFNITLGIYVAGVIASACSWDFWSLAAFRVLTGFGIGGEYAAINSAIDELIPARLRGRIDLMVNGSYWGGAALGAAASLLLLGGAVVSPQLGWRLGFGVGGVLGLGVLFLRRFVPEEGGGGDGCGGGAARQRKRRRRSRPGLRQADCAPAHVFRIWPNFLCNVRPL